MSHARCRREGDVEVAINPEELEGLDDAAVQALYRQRLEAQQQSQQREVRCPALLVHGLHSLLQHWLAASV